MSFEVLSDFEFHSAVPTQIIEKYKNIIPQELLDIWQNYGFGTLANGYMKIVNPDDYVGILKKSYFASNVSVPLFATGFADVITWQKGRYVGLVKYRRSKAPLYPFRFNDFLADFNSSKTADFLDNSQYSTAIQLLGKLEYDECFGYVPLLALGGSEKADKLRKMKIIQHIDFITQMVGRIE